MPTLSHVIVNKFKSYIRIVVEERISVILAVMNTTELVVEINIRNHMISSAIWNK